ncbi:hypothetical protein [Dyella ginsengisoli]|uniref:hypothetical protein n=1 Tax=Dyella ginsengisoli TaxID=363848 RepID=UPI0012FD5306|nr:hypothetical protein [Dyella ginsengisoli]
MSRPAHAGTVVSMAAHPATPRHRAMYGAAQPQAGWVALADLPGDPRLAARIARRDARSGYPQETGRVTVFLRLILLRRLWRRCCRGLSVSRRWWAPVKPTAPSTSPDGMAGWPKRSPRPTGAHLRRDFPSVQARRRPLRDGSSR